MLPQAPLVLNVMILLYLPKTRDGSGGPVSWNRQHFTEILMRFYNCHFIFQHIQWREDLKYWKYTQNLKKL